LVVPRSMPTARAIFYLLYDEWSGVARRYAAAVVVVLVLVTLGNCFVTQCARHRLELSNQRSVNLRL